MIESQLRIAYKCSDHFGEIPCKTLRVMLSCVDAPRADIQRVNLLDCTGQCRAGYRKVFPKGYTQRYVHVQRKRERERERDEHIYIYVYIHTYICRQIDS